MKKNLIFTTITAILTLTGCSDANVHNNRSGNQIASLFASKNSDSSQTSSNTSYSVNSAITSGAPTYDKIDIDLTTMGSNMVYSQVYNMLASPSSYVGKIVKINGPFAPLSSDDPNYCYPAILIQDATACCANGMEFLLYGIPRCGFLGGNGYPSLKENATIVGRFETYLEYGSLFVHLVDAIWLKD